MKAVSQNPKNVAARSRVKLAYLPSAGLIHGAHACMDGAERYGPYNWRNEKIAGMEYVSAAMRHISCWIDGEDTASDSGVHHLGHAIASLAILLDALECGAIIDDRPVAGKAVGLFRRIRNATAERLELEKELKKESGAGHGGLTALPDRAPRGRQGKRNTKGGS